MSKGRLTREHVVSQAFELASKNGLESLTIGALAKHCGLSKSGLFAHFNAKENLQIAVIDYAQHVFAQRVIEPVRLTNEHPDTESKLRGLLSHWLNWNHAFQGSCMFLDAWKDVHSTACPIQAALNKTIRIWVDYLAIQIRKGVEQGQFVDTLSPEQAVFELYGLYLSTQLFGSLLSPEQSEQHFWQGVEPLFARWRAV